jgi:hypothetical protein
MPKPSISGDQSESHFHSELFTVRMWREVLNGHSEWRGKVLHSGSRKECYFRDWQMLITFIQGMLPDTDVVVGC